jgi:hypothetical protein
VGKSVVSDVIIGGEVVHIAGNRRTTDVAR